MTDARGIVAAGATALVISGAHAIHRAWPAARGTEIHVAATLTREAYNAGLVRVRLPFERIELDVPRTAAAPEEPFVPLPRSGDWWVTGGDPRANSRRLRGRPLYVQLTPGPALFPGGPAEMRASTVSATPVSGAVNLAGIVTSVREEGYVRLDFAFAPVALPSAVRAGAAAAILRVLPSGRAVLTGILVDGRRY